MRPRPRVTAQDPGPHAGRGTRLVRSSPAGRRESFGLARSVSGGRAESGSCGWFGTLVATNSATLGERGMAPPLATIDPDPCGDRLAACAQEFGTPDRAHVLTSPIPG